MKPSQLPLLLLLLVLVQLTASTDPRGDLHVRFIQYAVPDSRLDNGRYCDSIKILTWERRISACDPQINLCVGSGDPKSCTVGKIALPYVSNADTVTFGERIGDQANPVSVPFDNLPPKLSLGATIYDHDRVGTNDLIESISGSVVPSRSKKIVQLSGRTHLKIEVWFTCASNYFGYLCRMYNYCIAKPCGDHGSCVNQPDAFKCHCQAGWTGARCDTEAAGDPCAGRKARRFHECRIRYRSGRPEVYAVEHTTSPVAMDGRCVSNRSRRTITGAEASRMCRG